MSPPATLDSWPSTATTPTRPPARNDLAHWRAKQAIRQAGDPLRSRVPDRLRTGVGPDHPDRWAQPGGVSGNASDLARDSQTTAATESRLHRGPSSMVPNTVEAGKAQHPGWAVRQSRTAVSPGLVCTRSAANLPYGRAGTRSGARSSPWPANWRHGCACLSTGKPTDGNRDGSPFDTLAPG